MPVQSFKLRSDLAMVIRRDFSLATPDLLKPSNGNPLEMGEFLAFDGSYHLVRGDGSAPAFCLFTEKGRSDTQAIGKATVLFLGMYEAETMIYTAAGMGVGLPLKVDAAVFYGGLNRSGLMVHPLGVDTDLVVGYCTHYTVGGFMRFIRTNA